MDRALRTRLLADRGGVEITASTAKTMAAQIEIGRIGLTQERMMRKTNNVATTRARRMFLCLAIGCVAVSQAASGREVGREAAYAQAFAFMRTYYQQANLDKALDLTIGEARQLINTEIRRRKAAGVSRDAVPPSAEFKGHTVKEVDGDFVMMWSVLSGAGLSFNVTTRSVLTDAGWRVSSFKESKDK
jgi:hypothetical protein